MAETQAAPVGDANPASSSNLTRAGITGKVPDFAKPRGHKGRKGKGVRMAGHRRAHAKQLMKAGAISPKAAASTGLATGGAKK
jgi:hypothetical protein